VESDIFVDTNEQTMSLVDSLRILGGM